MMRRYFSAIFGLHPVSLTIDWVVALFRNAFTAKTNGTPSFTKDRMVLSIKLAMAWHFLEVHRRENSTYSFYSPLISFSVFVVDRNLHSPLHL